MVGLPPFDILDDLVVALRAKGLDVDVIFERAVACSNEWIYDPCRPGGYRDRFAMKYDRNRTLPIKWRSLAATLNPQPGAFAVIRKLLCWIDRCDAASRRGLPAPPFLAEDGSAIFPPEGSEDELWWLTDVKRKEEDKKSLDKADEDGPPSSESDVQDDGADEQQKPADALTSDSDPDSPRSDQEPMSQGVILPVRHDSQQQSTHTPQPLWADGARNSANG